LDLIGRPPIGLDDTVVPDEAKRQLIVVGNTRATIPGFSLPGGQSGNAKSFPWDAPTRHLHVTAYRLHRRPLSPLEVFF
jgi:hypothetical protein